ncbi:MAG TPA: hypothetical protein VFO45_09395 [Sphingomicrobium sp.]|nr:hypothetical protein [Sphingomicrobium sp.]
MARPNLSVPAELKAYRRELRSYLRPWRMAGLFMVIGASFWLIFRDRESPVAWAAMVAGWIVLVAIVALRTRYHLRRMREPA